LFSFLCQLKLNKADAAALDHYLTGVGEGRSKEIVKYRKEYKKVLKRSRTLKVLEKRFIIKFNPAYLLGF